MQYQSADQKRLGFRIHALSFVGTMILLSIINVVIGSPFWVIWVLPGWAVGLFCHWYFVLGRDVSRA